VATVATANTSQLLLMIMKKKKMMMMIITKTIQTFTRHTKSTLNAESEVPAVAR